MKKILSAVAAILLAAALLAGCATTPKAGEGQSPLPSPPVSPTVSPSAAPSPTLSASPSPSASDFTYKQPAEDTVVIASNEGFIIGGYSGGKWLGSADAAAYCGGPMEFYCNIGFSNETVHSSGVHMENGGYRLNIADTDFSHCLYYANPESFPEYGEDKTKLAKQAVQKRLDDRYGKGKAVAYVNWGRAVDIDNDGTSEILFDAGSFEGPFSGADWYDMAGIIEEDGSMHFIAENYNTDTEGSILIWVYNNIIDIDGDGTYEFVAGSTDFEKETYKVYKYDGKDFMQVISTVTPEPEAEPPADYPSSTPPPDITYKQPAKNTVILADSFGYIIGGYSGGKWLTPEKAANYCVKPMTFYECSLDDRNERTDSSGVSSEESQSITGIWNKDMDESALFDYVYLLDIGEADRSGFLVYAGQDRFPQISELTDTDSSLVLSTVQQRLDEHFGSGKVTAQIYSAASADIDDDGSEEIVFNSCNIMGDDSGDYADDEDYEDYEDDEDYEYEGNWYCLSGIIEEDGSLHLLGEDYETGLPEEAVGEVISSIIDIDGDGRCEMIAEVDGYEVWTTLVYKYDPKTDGREFESVIFYKESA